MKKYFLFISIIMIAVFLTVFVGCDAVKNRVSEPSGNNSSVDATNNASVVTENAATDEIFANLKEATDEFSILTEDGAYQKTDKGYTIVSGGVYTLSGALDGQILVLAEDAEVEIELNGATIVCSFDSPIKILSADKAEISAKKDTTNFIKDTRAEKSVDSDEQGAGAIYAKCDLKMKGNGILVVEAGYNNGVHTTKDLTVKNLSLKVQAVNFALKGNHSVTTDGGVFSLISTKGDGIKTQDSDLSSKGAQRGTITVDGGSAISVYAAGDGVQASYDFVMNAGSLSVYTGSYSSYTASGATTTSYKGIKAANELTVNGGTIIVKSYDDGLHADYGTSLENGEKGKGNVNVLGGTITIGVYSPTKSTAGGKIGGRGWSNQQSVSGSDAIHADNTLTISDGTIRIDSAYEGLEANHIVISGGETTIFASDDGVNAYRKTDAPTILVSGGKLDVTVPASGDTDGIDSNGTYKQTGGLVISRGPGSASGKMGGGAWALDTDGGVTLQGGTLIVFGGIEGTPSASGVTKTVCSSSSVAAGAHTVKVGSATYEITLQYSTSGCVVYSDGGSATLR